MVRRSPRALALWGGAAAVALVTAVVVASDLATIHRRAADLGPVVHAVVTTRDVALGTELRASDLAERPVHRSELPGGALEGARSAVGRVITVPVVRGSFVTAANLAPRRRTGLDGAVPPGHAGDAGDRHQPAPPPPRRGRRRARHVRHRRPVRRAGQPSRRRSSWPRVSSSSASTTRPTRAGAHGDTLGITLLVDATDAERLAFAEANGVSRSRWFRRRTRRADSIRALSVLHAIILGIVQGLSEFLPISSSGHLILVPQLLGWHDLRNDNSLNKSFDVALHLGTLIAALWYFRRDVWRYVVAAWESVRARADHDRRPTRGLAAPALGDPGRDRRRAARERDRGHAR